MADPEVPVPLRADAERNRQRLLASARELFTERGLDVTLDEIARHAGVGTGTAYRRFANKDELVETLMVDRLDELAAIARECLADPDPWRGLSGYFERALAKQAADRGLKDVLFTQARGGEGVAAARAKLAPTVTKLVKRAIDAGAVRADFATSDVPLIIFMLNTIVDFGRDSEPELYRRYLAVVLDGLRPAREGPTPLPLAAVPIADFQKMLAGLKQRRGGGG